MNNYHETHKNERKVYAKKLLKLENSHWGAKYIQKFSDFFSFYHLSGLTDSYFFNPEHGGLPESTAVAGWVGATPTPVTLLKSNSRV